ncbi:MAG: trypsin-like serine protease [Gammaproteobacteria bacterium]
MTKNLRLLALAIGLGTVATAQASYVSDFLQSGQATVSPVLVAGDPAGTPPDSPANRVDPNLPTSPFTGVVSINIRFNGQSFICSGTAITPWHILTAAHCVDPNDDGNVIDITQPGNDVRVVVNNDGTFTPATDLITADQVTIHPDYEGFGICPDSSFGCVNDDIAILRLPTALPTGVAIYDLYDGVVGTGTQFTMVGYGTSGNGIVGYNVAPNFFVKRDGANIYDLFDTDDEQNFNPASPAEVWYYDFDGTRQGVNRDTFCLLGLACSAQLANDVETHLGGGDSGGPSFIRTADGRYLLVANNTFGINFCYTGDSPCRSGDFGDAGGGVLLNAYLSWIRATAVPEPGTLALLGLGLLGLAVSARRKTRTRA